MTIIDKLNKFKEESIARDISLSIRASQVEIDEIQKEISGICNFIGGYDTQIEFIKSTHIPKVKASSIRAYLNSLEKRSHQLQESIQQALEKLDEIDRDIDSGNIN